MAVIINEFEVITDAPQAAPGGTQSPTQSQAPQTGITPHTVVRLLRHQKRRMARVRAH